jgi:hypothetical protein
LSGGSGVGGVLVTTLTVDRIEDAPSVIEANAARYRPTSRAVPFEGEPGQTIYHVLVEREDD